jgi:hypothetical protein
MLLDSTLDETMLDDSISYEEILHNTTTVNQKYRFIMSISDVDIQIRAYLMGSKLTYCEKTWVAERKDLTPNWQNGKSIKWSNGENRFLRSLWFKDEILLWENFTGKRTSELEPFEENDTLLDISQGPKGDWD